MMLRMKFEGGGWLIVRPGAHRIRRDARGNSEAATVNVSRGHAGRSRVSLRLGPPGSIWRITVPALGSPAHGSRADHRAAHPASLTLSEPLHRKEVFVENSVEYADAQVLFDTGLSLVCLVDGIRVRIPTLLIQSGSEVRRNGDRGKLVIPKSLAINIGLA